MKTLQLLAALVAIAGAFVSGCLNLTSPAAPAEAHGLTLAVASSVCVQVHGPHLQMHNTDLGLAGSIAGKPGAGTTAFSHLDILFCDVSGRIVQTKPIRFSPRFVDQFRFGSRLGCHSRKLAPLPEGTTRIEVRAHNGRIAHRMASAVTARL